MAEVTIKAKTVRCKFKCNEAVKILAYNGKFEWRYKFSAVYGNGKENSEFFAATPYGQLEIGAFSENLFEPGQEYYLDMIAAALEEK